MNNENKCVRCGSVILESGRVQSTGKVYFRPNSVKFSAKKTADVSVDGVMCLTCGNIVLLGDVKKALSLIKPKRKAKPRQSIVDPLKYSVSLRDKTIRPPFKS